ncbi:hypothetical protein NUACC21_39350 [Scytonema sp. NUACC21]
MKFTEKIKFVLNLAILTGQNVFEGENFNTELSSPVPPRSVSNKP